MTRPVPEEPVPDDELFESLRETFLEWSTYCGHPRFMAYVSGAGTVPGAVADLLASGVNMNVGGWFLSPSATELERSVTGWFAERFGLPVGSGAGGLIVSGGAMANFVGLKLARDRGAGWDVRRTGARGGPPLAIYLSEETHIVSDRAADMLGLGTDAIRRLPVDEGFRMRVDALAEAIARDRDDGVVPVAVVASAGTVATGAVDPLEEIAGLCAREGIWMHVDGAYGGPAVLAEDLRPALAGIERADSIAFDPHKWLYTPHSGGCILVRDVRHLEESFGITAAYVKQDEEHAELGANLSTFGPQFSRGFWALKIWVSLLAHGSRAYGERISHDAALARYLGERVEARPEFELAVPVGLSICCFRYVPTDLPDAAAFGGEDAREAYLDRLNERLMTAIQQDGRAFCSNAVLRDRYVLRACVVNFRTEAEDMDALLEVAAELGAELDAELRPVGARA